MIKRFTFLVLFSVALFAVNAQDDFVLPVGHWSFDDSDGETVEDLSENGGTGTVYGEVEFTDETPSGTGMAIFFGGAGLVSIDDMPDVLEIEEDISISAWVKYSSDISGNINIICKGHFIGDTSGEIVIRPKDGLNFNIWNGAGEGATAAADLLTYDEWMHVVGVVEGTTYMVYINGELAATNDAGTHGAVFVAAPWAFGGRSFPDGAYDVLERMFTGFVDDVQIYNEAISEDHVMALFEGLGEVSTVGIETSTLNNVKVYPNLVSNGVVNIKSNVKLTAVKIINLNGQAVLSETMNGNAQSFDVSNLSKGLYIVTVADVNGNVSRQKISVK